LPPGGSDKGKPVAKLDEAEIARIVARAGGLGPRERFAYIKSACANDADAFDRVLLAHNITRANSAGEPDRGAERDAESEESYWATDRSGQALGSWRLKRRLGGGGMSDVYLAERIGEYSHQVAVKLVRPGLVSRADHNRLRAERQILARLNHRNIARLLDGGTTEDGIPYLVMEYVDGERIDLYCDRHRLTVTERLSLFRGVCAAVHAAHQNLVIHRDLKPSNILVTRDRTLKLLDFGIAKLIEVREQAHTVALTQADVRLFTPGHASPEQVKGELITTATDVYLLGVLLYELLTGRKPFEMRDVRLSEMERIICNYSPPLPSAVLNPRGAPPIEGPRIESAADARNTTAQRLRRELSGDLDNIVMKALRKEPERRYTSADEMAADLRRFEVGQPVIARRDTWRYRTGKFVGRHSMAVAASAAAVVVLAALATTMTFQAHRVTQERTIAERERLRSDETAKFLAGLFEVADPNEARGKEITAREILERGALRIQQELKDAPETQANLMETIGRVYLSLGLTPEARPQLEQALVKRDNLFPGDHLSKASNLSALGKLELAAGRLDLALRHYRDALAMNERLHGRHDLAVATSLEELGQLLKVQGDFKGAETHLEESLKLFTDLEGAKSTRVSSVMNELAQLMERRGDMGGAEDFYRRALAVRGVDGAASKGDGRETPGHAGCARQLRALPAGGRRFARRRAGIPPVAGAEHGSARRRSPLHGLRPRESRQPAATERRVRGKREGVSRGAENLRGHVAAGPPIRCFRANGPRSHAVGAGAGGRRIHSGDPGAHHLARIVAVASSASCIRTGDCRADSRFARPGSRSGIHARCKLRTVEHRVGPVGPAGSRHFPMAGRDLPSHRPRGAG
jgi:serine/threonine protein kinase